MDYYDPSKNINPDDWLALDELERQALIEEYVLTEEDEIDDSIFSVHASAHCLVENQLALKEIETVDAFERLRGGGVDRHEAIHALAAVLMENINEALANGDKDLTTRYKSKLKKLTAERWFNSEY
jgi:hypothetical protein